MVTSLATAIDSLADAGFDIAHAFDAGAVARELGLPQLADGLGVLVGNTRALWPRFLAARRADPALASDPDPVERYTEQTIARVVSGITARTFYSHRRYDDAFLPFQQVAVATGLGVLSPGHLVIHPIYGPWFALRAIIVGEGDSPIRSPIAAPCRCDVTCSAALACALTAPGSDWRAWLAVRDACVVGRGYRYDDDQLHYHYTNDPSSLR